MQQFWTFFITTLTFVALALSIQLGLENTQENDWQDWNIKEAPLPPRKLGVSLKANRYHAILYY